LVNVYRKTANSIPKCTKPTHFGSYGGSGDTDRGHCPGSMLT